MNKDDLEAALDVNRETMVSLAWCYAFGQYVDEDYRKILRTWWQIQTVNKCVETQPFQAALMAVFQCSEPTARKLINEAIRAGFLTKQSAGHDERFKIFQLTKDTQKKRQIALGLNQNIDAVIKSQRQAKLGDFKAGSEILPPEVYFDSRDPHMQEKLKNNINKSVVDIRADKKGKAA